MKSTFFLPWQEKEIQMDFSEKKIYTPIGDNQFLSDTNGIRRVKPPFFSIPSAKGMLAFFLAAMQKGAEVEAKEYISRRLLPMIDMKELRGLFSNMMEYQCLCGERRKGINTLHLTMKEKGGKTTIFDIAMVKEKTDFGQWKIFQITKE